MVISLITIVTLTIARLKYQTLDSSDFENWNLVLSSDGQNFPVNNDYSDHLNLKGLFSVSGTFDYNGDLRGSLKFIADDCLRSLKINDKEVLPEANENWCDYQNGFSKSIAPFLIKGSNRIEAQIENFDGRRQFSISGKKYSPLVILLYFLALIWLLLLERWLVLKGCLKIAFRIFTILSLYYFSLTAPNQRTYDVFEGGGHADYIKYVAQKGELPEIGTGWEYHQPAVYYLLAASVYRLIGIETESVPWEAFQAFNWLLFQLFIAIGLRTLSENLTARWLIPASFLFALWPMNLAHSVRIGNDNLIYVLCGAAIMFFLRWCKSLKPSDLLCASGYTAIACFTKSTALPLVAAISFIACIQLIAVIVPRIKSIIRPWLAETLSGARLKGAIAVVGALLTVAVLSLFPKLLNPEIHNAEAFLFPGVTSHPNLRIAIGSSTFLPFASLVGAFKPFVSPWVDASGRSNFWIYLFKSAQTGELFSTNSTLSFLAYLYLFSSYVFLALILYGVLTLLIKAKQTVLPCLLLIAAGVAGLIVSTLAQPNACNQDFRYIYYLLIPLIILAMAGLGNLSHKLLRVVCMLPIILIIVAGNFLILGIALNF